MSEKSAQIEPIEGQCHEGRQWGWRIRAGVSEFRAVTGGTGTCWNIGQDDLDGAPTAMMHVCELDDLIEALVALRDSDAHRDHLVRWGEKPPENDGDLCLWEVSPWWDSGDEESGDDEGSPVYVQATSEDEAMEMATNQMRAEGCYPDWVQVRSVWKPVREIANTWAQVEQR